MTTKALRKSPELSKPVRRRAPKVFLSYNRLDHELAQRFADRLKAAGYAIANPADSIEPGQNWLLVVGKALESSDAVVLFLSAAALRSEATRLELDYVLSRKKFKDRVVPVLLSEDVAVPWIVRRLPFVSMRKAPADDVLRAANAVVKELEQRL
jgi:hypothetical protein